MLSDSAFLDVNDNGDAVLVFTKVDGDKNYALAKIKTADGDWSKSFKLSKKAKVKFPWEMFPKVSLNNAGDAVALWNFGVDSKHPQQELLQASSTAIGAQGWTAIDNLTPSVTSEWPSNRLVVDTQGNTLAVWMTATTIESSLLLKGTTKWVPLPSINLGYPFNDVLLKEKDGKVWLIWAKGYGFVFDSISVSQFSYDTQSWSDPLVLAPEGADHYWFPNLAIDPQGNVFATWQLNYKEGRGADFVCVRYDVNRDVWETTHFKQPRDNNFYNYLRITFDPQGNALCIYPDDYGLISSSLAAGSLDWSEPVWVTTDDVSEWSFTADTQGNRLFTWIEWHEKRIKTAILLANDNRWSYPDRITTADHLVGTKLYGNGQALIVFSKGAQLFSVTGSSLLNQDGSKPPKQQSKVSKQVSKKIKSQSKLQVLINPAH